MIKALAHGTVDALRTQPLTLALVVINLLFIAWGVVIFRQVADAGARRDKLIADMVERCIERR